MRSPLELAPARPFHLDQSVEIARSGRFALRRDELRWPDGTNQTYTIIEGPQAAIVVPVWEDGTTVLVRQWRHPWDSSSWEVPSGTLNREEEPVLGAGRELIEEAGLEAGVWIPLGTGRPSASATFRFHFFLAQDLREVPRAPEDYEQDMIVRSLPLSDAVDAALAGDIVHAGSVVALCRSARRLGLI